MAKSSNESAASSTAEENSHTSNKNAPKSFLKQTTTKKMTKGAMTDSKKRARRLVVRRQAALKFRKVSLPRGKGGRQARKAQRGCGFSDAEVNRMLELLEYHCPIGQEQWELVTETHNQSEEFPNRKVASIRNKFRSLCRKKTALWRDKTSTNCCACSPRP